MPSFDVVSEVDMHEVTNAMDQTNKEVNTRFDLKNTGSNCRRDENVITVVSDSEFHLQQVVEVLREKLAKVEAAKWAEENTNSIKAYNDFVEEHGCFGEEYREF